MRTSPDFPRAAKGLPLIESLTPPAFPTVNFSGLCKENFLDSFGSNFPEYKAESRELTDNQQSWVASIPSISCPGLGGSSDFELSGTSCCGTTGEVSRFLARSPVPLVQRQQASVVRPLSELGMVLGQREGFRAGARRRQAGLTGKTRGFVQGQFRA